MELRAVPGFGFNSWADGKPASEVRAAGMTPLGWHGVRVQSVYLSY